MIRSCPRRPFESLWPYSTSQVRDPLERLLSAYRYVFHQTSLHKENDLNLRILLRYGSISPDDITEEEYREEEIGDSKCRLLWNI